MDEEVGIQSNFTKNKAWPKEFEGGDGENEKRWWKI